MASPFREFSQAYDKFKETFPSHPLTDEIRSRLSRGRFPNEQWLRSRIVKMQDLMAPSWLRGKASSSEKDCA